MNKNQSGQALVLVLLGLAVVLTVVLFILSRSVTDISVSSSQSQSASAFSAAEAGVEQTLVVGSAPSGSTLVGTGGASYTAGVTPLGGTSFVYPIDMNSGDDVVLWLKSQDSSPNFTGTNLKICWGKPGTYSDPNMIPAIEVSLYYGATAATTQIFRSAYDSNSSRPSPNSFTLPDNSSGACSISGKTFKFSKTISLSGLTNPQFVVVRMFYNTDTSQPVGFSSTDSSTFPTQGITIDSSGTSGTSTRRVEVFQSWSEVPSIFQYAIFSPVGVTDD